MTPTYRYYPEEKVIREQPTMKKEICLKGISSNLCSTIIGKDCDCEIYKKHIASLKSYPAEGFSSQHEGKELIEEKDFIIIYDKGCSRHHYNHSDERCDGKDTAIPIEPAKEIISDDYQMRVNEWMQVCFGECISKDIQERNHRFIEEALELIQSNGATKSECHQLVDYVYGRPIGETVQEIGGVMVTLAALCNATKNNMNVAGEIELKRVWTAVEKIRAKQATKPKHSPLPQEIVSNDMEKQKGESFYDYIVSARNSFVNIITKHYPHLKTEYGSESKEGIEIRVAVEDVLIAYDQMKEELSKYIGVTEALSKAGEELIKLRAENLKLSSDLADAKHKNRIWWSFE